MTEPEDYEIEGGDIGELAAAEYLVFLLAMETYARYLDEQVGPGTQDDLLKKAIVLVRAADRQHQGSIQAVLSEHLAPPKQKILDKAFRLAPTQSGIRRRSLNIRMLMTRGGPTVMRSVFKTNKALQEVRAAMGASMIDDADAALDKFAVIPMRNARFRKWIDDAAENAGSGAFQNPVAASNESAAETTDEILVTRAQQNATAPTEEEPRQKKDDLLLKVQTHAKEAAERAMKVTGEADEPPVKSEVVGIATAAAVAAVTDPSISTNVPVPLRKLDDEQRAAAMTDGKVLVAAGAGAGKSTTVVSRVDYLVKDRRVPPSKILVTSFNTKAANELKQKIGTAVGGDALNQMSVGTMHSLFRRFIGEYGTAKEKYAVGIGKDKGGFVQGGAAVARAVQKIWAECHGEGSDDERPVPKLKSVLTHKSKWVGNEISPKQAREEARTSEERDAAEWYEMYEGLMGTIPGWRPPCSPSRAFESFMGRYRPNNQRLGDFDSMLGIYASILKRDPAVRKQVQAMYDNIIVDEAQDLNKTQAEIVKLMTEHVSDGKDGKSLWICGDDKQSIYGFRGARPDLFTELATTPGWKTKMIRTNYRCQPEIVDSANKLIANNEKQIPMAAVPSSEKVRGTGAIRVQKSGDEAEAALDTIEEIKANIEAGEDVAANAILTRTNKEQHAFETACIIRGIPYARKGASSFLGSPETKAFLSYVQLVTGDDFTKMQAALGEVVNKPNRFFVAPDVGAEAVSQAFSDYARRAGKDVKSISPMAALSDDRFVEILAQKLTRSRDGFKYDKAVEKLEELASDVRRLKADSADPKFTTKSLFDSILGMTGTTTVTDPVTGNVKYVEQTFRQSLKADLRDKTDDDDDTEDEDDDEDEETKGLGNISFLYQLVKPDPTDPQDLVSDPNTPYGFKAKMDRFAQKARDLRIDLTKWDKEQAALPPEQRKAPPGVYLGTVHSTKGAQWNNCYVSMPAGKFPFQTKTKPGQPPPPPEVLQEEEESERRLGYVAMTRAAKNLTILCPDQVGGKAAGVSRFVDEAGLRIGENVEKPGQANVDPAAAAEEDQVKVARAPATMSEWGEEPYEAEPWLYDWRGAK